MLIALNDRDERIIPSLLTFKEIETLRNESFYCPQCKEKVYVRAGPRVIPHFAHLPHSTCTASKAGESNYHKRAKLLLLKWLQQQRMEVMLEQYIEPINQRPDLLIEMNHQQVALEFQSSLISERDLHRRNKGYKAANIIPYWILGKNRLRKIAPHMYRIATSQKLLFHTNDKQTKLYYFCPDERHFIILSDIHLITSDKFIAHQKVTPLTSSRFSNLFDNDYLSKQILYKLWYKEKEKFRLASYRFYGRELQYRRWLYEKRLHVEQLPSVIHLPIQLQHKMRIPLWHWQSELVINLLHPLQTGRSITLTECIRFLIRHVEHRNQNVALKVIEQYFIYLEMVKLFKRVNKQTWIKLRHFRFHRYIEQSLQADRLMIQFLCTHTTQQLN